MDKQTRAPVFDDEKSVSRCRPESIGLFRDLQNLLKPACFRSPPVDKSENRDHEQVKDSRFLVKFRAQRIEASSFLPAISRLS
jgi:hypothetical protein